MVQRILKDSVQYTDYFTTLWVYPVQMVNSYFMQMFWLRHDAVGWMFYIGSLSLVFHIGSWRQSIRMRKKCLVNSCNTMAEDLDYISYPEKKYGRWHMSSAHYEMSEVCIVIHDTVTQVN